MACKLCSKKLYTNSEFTLNENTENNVICKSCCCLVKKAETKRLNTHRLSSRQKEILESKFLQTNCMQNENLTKNNVFVISLAKEVGCTKKSLINFLFKQQEKLKEHSNLSRQINLAKENILLKKKNTIDLMLEELKKIDRVLAPNQCPFSQRNTQKSILI